MRVVVAGGTGFIGRHLCQVLVRRGDNVVVLTRSSRTASEAGPEGLELRQWNPSDGTDLEKTLDGADAVINLCGENVAEGRWTADRKRALEDSRTGPTTTLVDAIGRCENKPRILINSSAVGYYGDRGDEELTEDSSPGEGFLPEMCVRWEKAAQAASEHDVRVILLRIGVVLEKSGGALQKMLPPFNAFLGGPLGNGRQYFPWIHLNDVSGLIVYALSNTAVEGPLNCVAPHPVTNEAFSRTLASTMARPCLFRVPEFAVKALFGEMSEILLGSTRAVPSRALEKGYFFRFHTSEDALKYILGNYTGEAPNQWWPFLSKNG